MSAPEPTWDDELRQAELVTLRRLRQLAAADDPKVALRACETLAKLVTHARREQVRAAVARTRAEPARRPEPPPAPRREPQAPARPRVPQPPHLLPDGAPLG